MKVKHILLCLILISTMFSTMGCRLIFEPDVDAVSRLYASMPTGDNRVVREMCSGDDVCQKINTVAGIVKSSWYVNKKDFFTITQVEIAEDTGYSYVHTKIRLPGAAGQEDTMLPLVFEMERIKLRWYIYSVDGIEEFIRRAERNRGIL